MPKALIIAGANGAGKTTFARNLVPYEHPECTFLNADEIQREAPSFASPVSAGRELIRRMATLVSTSQSFAVETTLSSASYARQIPSWRSQGFQVWLYFLEVETADLAVARVAQRVAGGHGIPDQTFVADTPGDWRCFQPTKSWRMRGISIGSIRKALFVSDKKTLDAKGSDSLHAKRADEAMRRATEQATKGPREARAGRFDWKSPPKAAE